MTSTFKQVLGLYEEGTEEYELISKLDVKVRTMLYYRFCGCSKCVCVTKAFNTPMNSNSATRKYNQLLEQNPGWDLYLEALEKVRERKGEVTANSFLDVLHNIATGSVTTNQPMVVKDKIEWVELEPTIGERIKSSEVALKNLNIDNPGEDEENQQIIFVEDL